MHSRTQRRLIGLNAALLGALAVVTIGPGIPGVGAQNQPSRARGEYTMISGSVQGGSADVVYILDAANEEMIAMGWDRSRNELHGIGYRSLSSDSRVEATGR